MDDQDGVDARVALSIKDKKKLRGDHCGQEGHKIEKYLRNMAFHLDGERKKLSQGEFEVQIGIKQTTLHPNWSFQW
jgi:hypothetical protein